MPELPPYGGRAAGMEDGGPAGEGTGLAMFDAPAFIGGAMDPEAAQINIPFLSTFAEQHYQHFILKHRLLTRSDAH